MATKKSHVTLRGTEALTITEARALIRAVLRGRESLRFSEREKLLSACAKIADGLLAAGQDRNDVQALLDEKNPPADERLQAL